MANRPAALKQTDATRLFKAAKAAGFGRARIINHPDGRTEFIGEDGPELLADEPTSPFEKWKAQNASKD